MIVHVSFSFAVSFPCNYSFFSFHSERVTQYFLDPEHNNMKHMFVALREHSNNCRTELIIQYSRIHGHFDQWTFLLLPQEVKFQPRRNKYTHDNTSGKSKLTSLKNSTDHKFHLMRWTFCRNKYVHYDQEIVCFHHCEQIPPVFLLSIH